LPKAEHDTEDRQAAMEALSLVAKHDGPQRPRHRNDRASMSEMGPTEKNSVRANVFRFARTRTLLDAVGMSQTSRYCKTLFASTKTNFLSRTCGDRIMI
jgi:hypothetical protein